VNVKILVCITCIYIIFIYKLKDFTEHPTDHMNSVIKRKKNNNNSNKAVINVIFIYQLQMTSLSTKKSPNWPYEYLQEQ